MTHFNKESKNIFTALVADKLDENNFEFYFYHNSINKYTFNRGCSCENGSDWLVAIEMSNNGINQILAYTNSKDEIFLDKIFDFISPKSNLHGIMGSYSVVSHILRKYPNNFEIFMDRIFYELERKNSSSIPLSDDYEIVYIDHKDYLEVAQMKVNFSKEEWKEKNTKTTENILAQWQYKPNIVVLKEKNKKVIIGYCEINSEDMIGTIYIKNEYRNKGYGKKLTYLITQEMLKNTDKIKVMTTANNDAMKSILKDLGYHECCKHLEIWKLKY